MRVAGAKGWIPMSSSNLAPPYLGDHWRGVEDAAAQAGEASDRRQWRPQFVRHANGQ